MAKSYITRCIVKRNGKEYKKGSIVEGLSKKEIEQGVAQGWLMPVGHDDSDNAKSQDRSKKSDKPVASREQLLAEAAALGILDTITQEMTAEEIQQAIDKAQQ